MKHKVQCGFCSNKITIQTWTSTRRGKSYRNRRIVGGFLVITNGTDGLPVCRQCYGKATDVLMKPENYRVIKRDTKGRFVSTPEVVSPSMRGQK